MSEGKRTAALGHTEPEPGCASVSSMSAKRLSVTAHEDAQRVAHAAVLYVGMLTRTLRRRSLWCTVRGNVFHGACIMQVRAAEPGFVETDATRLLLQRRGWERQRRSER